MIVTESTDRGVGMNKEKEIDSVRVFHEGPLHRCPDCGRRVFLPCLACATERGGRVRDPLDADMEDEDFLRIQLRGEERRRYEYFHLKKVAETIQAESCGDDELFS